MTSVPPEAWAFFDDLAADNSAAFWQANKARFEREVKAPFAEVLQAIEPELGSFKVFRMHRDTRFSSDKAPLKTMHGAVDRDSGLRYLHVDRDGVLLVCGAYVFTREQLAAWRYAVANSKIGAELGSLIAALQVDGIAVTPGGSTPMKRLPSGYEFDASRANLLRWKGCMATQRILRDDRAKTSLAVRAMAFWQETAAFWRVLSHALRDGQGSPSARRTGDKQG